MEISISLHNKDHCFERPNMSKDNKALETRT